ncbi:MAG: DUF4255 domain-containing protein, partial [Bacteroidetes bacterium]|nr:DUF4255 domain-containing protein [Bacteroidota bacterium]
MIYEALSCLVDDMNEYFRNRLRINEDKVALSAIVNQDGTVAIQGENKVAVSIVNVEKEITGKSNASPVIGGTIANKSSSMNINLYILFSAYFSSRNYPEALRFLSFVIAYFQYKNVFTSANTAKLDPGIDKLVFEVATISPEQLNNIWASLGAKYMPSIIY